MWAKTTTTTTIKPIKSVRGTLGIYRFVLYWYPWLHTKLCYLTQVCFCFNLETRSAVEESRCFGSISLNSVNRGTWKRCFYSKWSSILLYLSDCFSFIGFFIWDKIFLSVLAKTSFIKVPIVNIYQCMHVCVFAFCVVKRWLLPVI